MADYVKDVSPGLAEYFGVKTINDGESLSFEFNQEITIDDIIITSSTPSSTHGYRLDIEYRASDVLGKISDITLDSTSPTWFLNDQSNGGKKWYRLPARTIISLTNTGVTTPVITMTLVGRAG